MMKLHLFLLLSLLGQTLLSLSLLSLIEGSTAAEPAPVFKLGLSDLDQLLACYDGKCRLWTQHGKKGRFLPIRGKTGYDILTPVLRNKGFQAVQLARDMVGMGAKVQVELTYDNYSVKDRFGRLHTWKRPDTVPESERKPVEDKAKVDEVKEQTETNNQNDPRVEPAKGPEGDSEGMTEDELAEALEALKEGINLPFSVLKKVMIHMGRWPGSSVAVKDNSSGVGTVTGSKDAPVHVKWRSTDKYDENHPLAQFEEDRLRRMEQRRQEFLRKGHEEMGIVVGTKKAAEVEQLKDQQQDLYAQLDKLEAEEAKVKRRDHIMHQAFLERHQEEFGSQLPQLSDERWVVEEEKILEEKQRNMERNGRRTKPNGPISRLREKLRESQAARDDIKAEMDRLIQEERLVEEEIEDRKNHREFNAEREEAFNQFKKRMQSVMETNKNQKLIHGNFKDHHEYPTVDFDTWMREHKDAGMEGGL